MQKDFGKKIKTFDFGPKIVVSMKIIKISQKFTISDTYFFENIPIDRIQKSPIIYYFMNFLILQLQKMVKSKRLYIFAFSQLEKLLKMKIQV